MKETPSLYVAAFLGKDKEKKGGGGDSPEIQLPKDRPLRFGRTTQQRTGIRGRRELAGKRINSIVKAKYVAAGADSRRHIIQHVDYILKRERAQDEKERTFFDEKRDEVPRDDVIKDALEARGPRIAMYKIILSPGENAATSPNELRMILAEWQRQTGIEMNWVAVVHKNTEHHHFHVLLHGTDKDGHSYMLKPEDLDLLREIANGRQYELQGRPMELEKILEQEYGIDYEMAMRAFDRWVSEHGMKEMGYDSNPTDTVAKNLIDDARKDQHLSNEPFDPYEFSKQIEKQLLLEDPAVQEYLAQRDLERELARQEAELKAAEAAAQLHPIDRQAFIEKFQQDLAKDALLLEQTPFQNDLSKPEYEGYKALFTVLHPDLVGKDPKYLLLSEIEQSALRYHPHLQAQYRPETANYYLARLNEFLKDNPEYKAEYDYDASDPESVQDVLTRFLDRHPMLAAELVDPKLAALIPDRADDKPEKTRSQLPRPYESKDIDLSKIPDSDKLYSSGQTVTKYHSLEELVDFNNKLVQGILSRISLDDYKLLGKWTRAKELSGENVYGLPPDFDLSKIDPEIAAQIEKERFDFKVEQFKQRILNFNQNYEKFVPNWKSPAEVLQKAMEGIGERFPELVNDFTRAMAHRFTAAWDEFSHFLPGNEGELARENARLDDLVKKELVLQEKAHNDREKLHTELIDRGTPLSRDEIAELEPEHVAKMLEHFNQEHLDRGLLLAKQREAKDPDYTDAEIAEMAIEEVRKILHGETDTKQGTDEVIIDIAIAQDDDEASDSNDSDEEEQEHKRHKNTEGDR